MEAETAEGLRARPAAVPRIIRAPFCVAELYEVARAASLVLAERLGQVAPWLATYCRPSHASRSRPPAKPDSTKCRAPAVSLAP